MHESPFYKYTNVHLLWEPWLVFKYHLMHQKHSESEFHKHCRTLFHILNFLVGSWKFYISARHMSQFVWYIPNNVWYTHLVYSMIRCNFIHERSLYIIIQNYHYLKVHWDRMGSISVSGKLVIQLIYQLHYTAPIKSIPLYDFIITKYIKRIGAVSKNSSDVGAPVHAPTLKHDVCCCYPWPVSFWSNVAETLCVKYG